jgi:hypothetical protein
MKLRNKLRLLMAMKSSQVNLLLLRSHLSIHRSHINIDNSIFYYSRHKLHNYAPCNMITLNELLLF